MEGPSKRPLPRGRNHHRHHPRANGLLVLGDGTRIVTTAEHTLLSIASSWRLSTIEERKTRTQT